MVIRLKCRAYDRQVTGELTMRVLQHDLKEQNPVYQSVCDGNVARLLAGVAAPEHSYNAHVHDVEAASE